MKSSTSALKSIVAFLLLSLPFIVGAQSLSVAPSTVNVNAVAGTCSSTITVGMIPTPPSGETVLFYSASGMSGSFIGPTLSVFQGNASVGTNTVTFTAYWSGGGTSTATATVTVNDVESPTIVCPPDKTVNVDGVPGTDCNALVNLDAPIDIFDNCSGVTWSPSPASATLFTGTTAVVYTATDQSGNTGTCTAIVVIDDLVDPTITCPGAPIVQGMDADKCGITLGDYTSDPTVVENCPTYTVAQVPAAGTVHMGADGTTVALVFTVTDGSGRTASCAATVEMDDDVAPTISCPSDATILADLGSCDNTTEPLASATAADNCSATVSDNWAGIWTLGSNVVTFTASDAVGNTATCTYEITVQDNENPVISGCPTSQSVPAAAGLCEEVINWVEPTDSDNCGVASFGRTDSEPANGAAFGVGTHVISYLVVDNGGLTATCEFTIEVLDTELPVISYVPGGIPSGTCPPNSTINTNGNAGCEVIIPDLINSGDMDVTDNCPTVVLTQDPTENSTASGYAHGDIITVTLTAEDESGNTSTCTFEVTVQDVDAPTITCPADATINTDAGVCENTSEAVAAATGDDNCTVTVTNDFTGTWALGDNTVTFTAEDAAGNTATCTYVVTVEDNEAPTITCPADATISTDAGVCENTSEPLGTPVETDNCSATVTNDFTGTWLLGDNTVTFTAEDAAGNTSACSYVVTVEDNENPTPLCNNVTVGLDANGETMVFDGDLDAGSGDNCAVASVVFTFDRDGDGNYDVEDVVSGLTLDCSDADGAATPYILTVTDNAGNTSSVACSVTVQDNDAPLPVCNDVTVELDAAGAYTEADIDANIIFGLMGDGSTDNCQYSYTVSRDGGPFDSQIAFGCADISADFDKSNDIVVVTLQVTDTYGNTATCDANVYVEDNIDPSQTDCPIGPIALNPDANCEVHYDFPATFDITDNCDLAVSYDLGDGLGTISAATVADAVAAIEANAYSTNPDGSTAAYDISILVEEKDGDPFSCDFQITVEDNTAPNCVPQAFTAVLDNSGSVTVVPGDVDGGSNDNCDPNPSIVINGGNPTYGCADVGPQTVTLVVTDINGNSSTCDASVMVEDQQDPVFDLCPATMTISTNEDAAGDYNCTTLADLASGISVLDNCLVTADATWDVSGVTTAAGSDPAGLDAVVFELGTSTVTVTATEGDGSSVTCSFDVTVVDDELPNAVCAAFTAQLDANGDVTVTAANVDGGSNDNCSFTLTSADVDFDCSHVGTPQTVTLEVTDGAGNTATCDATVTVEDNVPPTATCVADIVTTVDNYTCIAYRYIAKPAVSDNCLAPNPLAATWTTTAVTAPYPVVLTDFGGILPGVVGNFPTGETVVTFTVVDGNGNTATCDVSITVEENAAPLIVCPATATVSTDAGTCTGTYVADPNNATASDNCNIVDVTVAGDGAGLVDGSIITYTAIDPAGNTATCTQTVVVEDTEAPAAFACPAAVTQGTDAGVCNAVVTFVDPTTTDNCTLASVTADLASGSTFAVGTTTVTYTATDAAGNTTTCAFDVTVNDTENPGITCPADASVNTDAGVCTGTYAADIAGALATDNCSATVTATGDGSGLANGALVTYTATDAAGNTVTCQQTITVNDVEAPAISCPLVAASASDAGVCGAVVTFADATATDNCAVSSVTSDIASGTSFSVGTTAVTFTATDASGNTTTCSIDIIVNDTEAPSLVCNTIPKSDVDAGACSTNVSWVDPTPTDNCGVVSISSDIASGSSFNVGTTVVTYTAADAAGNTSTCTFDVVVDLPMVTATNVTNATCAGQSGNIDITVSAATTYLWSNGATTEDITDVAGTYTVTIGNASCAVTTSATITEPAAVSVSISSLACGGATQTATVTATGGSGTYVAYNWTPAVAGGASPVFTANGTYTVEVADNNGCTGSASVVVALCDTAASNSATNVWTTTATINWADVPCNQGYRVQYRANLGGGAFGPWTQLVVAAGTTSYNATALTPLTRYQYRIYTNCNGVFTTNYARGNFITLDTLWADGDGDGFGAGTPIFDDELVAGYSFTPGDCNDAAAAINPSATEVCDGIDNDCDSQIDESTTTTYYADADGDGFGNPTVSQASCTQPTGYVLNNTDCNDASVTSYPGATEVCDGLDNDCNGVVDNGTYTCPAPTGYAASNITATSAMVSWTGAPCSKSYRIMYRRTDQVAIVWTYFNVNAPNASAVISGLTPARSYFTRVRATCSNNAVSSQSAMITFTTLSSLNTPVDNTVETAVDTKVAPEFSINPNPGKGLFFVNLENAKDQTARLRVTDAFGKTVMTWNAGVQGGRVNESFDLSDVPAGVYFIKVELEEGTYTKTFIKE